MSAPQCMRPDRKSAVSMPITATTGNHSLRQGAQCSKGGINSRDVMTKLSIEVTAI